MSQQQLPFSQDPHKLARTTDPITSHLAAHANPFRRGTQLHALLLGYAALPDATCAEAEQYAGLQDTWRRTSDLHNKGFIEPVPGVLRPLPSGKLGQVYRITASGRSALNGARMP